jgi:branched-chain amino acid transport system substrate-binding protein
VKTDGKKKVGFMYCAEAPACKQAVDVLAAFAKPAGIPLDSLAVSASATSYAAPCVQFKGAGVDALFPGLDAATAVRVAAACAQQGFTPKSYVVSASYTPAWLTAPQFNGAVMVSSNANYLDASIPGVQAYQTAIKKYAPQLDLSKAGYNQFTVWVGGLLFQAAAKAANIGPQSSPADVKKGLYALKGDTLDGTAPPLTYQTGAATSNPCVFAITINSGKLVSDNNGKPTCLPAGQAAIAKSMAKAP